MLAHSPDLQLPKLSSVVRPPRGLLRISSTPGDQICTITDCLAALQLRITRLDRRPSLGTKPFDNLYFVEVEGDVDEEGWGAQLEDAKIRVTAAGGDVMLLGSW